MYYFRDNYQMSVTKLALYVSPKCVYSQSLLREINEEKLNDTFEVINIHEREIPDFIENVPTLLVDKGTKVEGRAIFMWIKNLVKSNNEIQAVEPDYNANPFTFINDHENEQSNLQNFYEISNNNSMQPMSQPPQSASSERGSIDLDRLVQERKSDVPQPPKRI
tara:strand:+ start:746 stop:1237 length:492 start_codon:yes stop_codon:yes gene_type:complete